MRALALLTLSLTLTQPLAALAQEAQAAAPGTQGEAQPETTASLPSITVATVATAGVRDRVQASGLIGPVEQIFVQPQIEGQAIDTLLADVGDRVAEGQELARLSETALTLNRTQSLAQRASAEASIAQAEASLVEAQATADEAVRQRDRTLTLTAQGTTTQSAADTASANATSALARVTQATQALRAAQAQLTLVDAQIADIDLQLKRTTIIAPVAGEITLRNATVGSIASAGSEPMFVIVREGLLELRADVAEQDILRLQPGQKAQLRVVGLTEPLGGTVRLVEPTVDEVTRLGRVRVAIDTPERVRAGMFADAEILVSEKDALVIPVSAMGGTVDDATVLRVRDGVVDQVAITTGVRDGAVIEVTEGLAAGDTIVAKAGAFVRDGDRINPVPATAGTATN